jgi:hypothetical protein
MGRVLSTDIGGGGGKERLEDYVGKPRRDWRPVGRTSPSWEDNIKIDLSEMRWGFTDWINLAQDRDQWWALVSTIINFRVR